MLSNQGLWYIYPISSLLPSGYFSLPHQNTYFFTESLHISFSCIFTGKSQGDSAVAAATLRYCKTDLLPQPGSCHWCRLRDTLCTSAFRHPEVDRILMLQSLHLPYYESEHSAFKSIQFIPGILFRGMTF